ncbi:aminotransferase class I/II-fold pyridoxal phosphate-dependent enzyme, partial [Escherichia coli]|uniref:aminotransferase class I/II-fold pyridoxal phosphate-dependent enzyme n=1 Tax=Escherichia coli TaxID=562 RepID=UPI0021195B59
NILVFSPVYNGFFDVIIHFERNIMTASLIIKIEGGYAINWQDFELKIKGEKMVLLSNPHNPTGTVLSEEELHKIAASCTR